jgi:hypothetical protein
MCTGSQYSNGIHRMWQEHETDREERLREYEEDLCKWEEEQLEFEREDLERECEELTREPPPPVPADTPTQPLTPLTADQCSQHTPDRHQHHTTIHTKSYPAPRSRPPPWPNKYRNRNQSRHNNSRYITARKPMRSRLPPWPNQRQQHNPRYTTTSVRPPPWPNDSDTSPILSITNPCPLPWPNQRHHRRKPTSSTRRSRPPPWPIIPRHSNRTLQNRWNAKRRIKARSRGISDGNSI